MKPATALAALLLATAAWTAQSMPPQKGMPAEQAAVVKGEVLETRDVKPYTYIRLKTKDGEIWAAVTATAVKKGAQVTIGNVTMMENFESKSLKRKFDRIVFGTIADPNAKPGATQAAPHGATPAASVLAAKVTKASGPDAKTVAEVMNGKATLKDKTVLVRGQVVKVNAGILGKNWVHLQDGSGSAKDSTHDVIVVTKDEAKVGDIVNAKGTVRTDVNVGSGYAYAILIDDAALRK